MFRRPRGRHWPLWTWSRRATAASILLLFVLSGLGLFPWLKGSLTAATWFELVPLADPLAALEVTLATRRLHSELLLGAALLVAFCVLVGPVFCAWLCPLGLLLDLNDASRRLMTRRVFHRHGEEQRPYARSASWPRYVLLGVTLGVALTMGIPVFQTVSPINIVVWSLVFAAGPGLAFVALILVAEQIWPRLWCRTLCPLGALYGLLGRFGALRVRIDLAEAGKSPCQLCSRRCPMGIRVMEDYSLAGTSSVDHPDCTRCGTCVDGCPGGVLFLGFRNRGHRGANRPGPSSAGPASLEPPTSPHRQETNAVCGHGD